MVKRKVKKSTSQPPAKRRKISNPTSFGPVSSVNTAPVAIGNSIRGTKPHVTVSSDGARVIGRDFAFSVAATASAVTGWTLVGGMPLTPCVMPSTSLKAYVQMYAKFKINRMNFHYITSSATSQTGDIMFHYEKDRMGSMIDWTNNSFLPYVLSDPHTVIGPQWTNHTMAITTVDGYNSTNYGINTDLNEESAGSLFIFSKTSSANSPGYILCDYDISFKELQVNPRAGILPIARGQWSQICFQATTLAVTSGSTNVLLTIGGDSVSDSAASLPTGATVNDVYKVILDVTNSTIVNAAWTNVTTANALVYAGNAASGSNPTVTLDDGFTCYFSLASATTGYLYPTLSGALNGSNTFKWGVTATVSLTLCASISLVAMNNSQFQASY